MAEEPPPGSRPKPPMSRIMRLSLRAVDYVADATRRADGTVNRRVLSLLDPRVPAFSSPCRGVASRDVVIDPTLRIRARLFHPARPGDAKGAPLPVIVFFHGGGFAFLSAASLAYDAACRRIARYASAAVLSVDYRRAPEHRFPAPYDDGLAALRFLDDPDNHPADVPLQAPAASSPGTARAATSRTTSPGATPRMCLRSRTSVSPASLPSSPSSAARSARPPSSALTARRSCPSPAPTGCGARSSRTALTALTRPRASPPLGQPLAWTARPSRRCCSSSAAMTRCRTGRGGTARC
uniref:Alpha/beta hydrolase fold-3 domain-containing protein n=1 Tax=Triticum urartu TaxID=4572 RepID=A0A8R7Q2Y7_TRIUA